MFGLKIIRTRDYQRMVERLVHSIKSEKDMDEIAKKNAEDCEGLRVENAKLRKEIDKLRSKAFDIDFEVVMNPKKCDKCKREQKYCKKVTICDKEVCIVPKQK